ncbi:hypothetical protein F441_01293 [Phytophthora nicotianae CJ01A1]|uniref:HAT C-terminal dimerisation domain-containing protein n=2 Tax=Phytophthora nicotianae TaxID=4792 RepID=W2XTR0_PHYNI|nr:hypothetical protein F441_01293 [Phytophthora nicotianae CJ01A1]
MAPTDTLLQVARPQAKFLPKQVATFFFKRLVNDNNDPTGYFECKACGRSRKQAAGTGHTNLKASNRFAWLEWVVKSNLPLSFVENPVIRRYTNLPPVSVDTLHLNMEAVTREVETIIGAEMITEFGLIFDGWSNGSEYYLAVYAVYSIKSGGHYPLLSMAPVVNEPEDDRGAESLLAAISTFLPFFGKTVEQCLFLVGDICSVNKKLANLMGVILVGCASHRLILALKAILAPYEADLCKVQRLMKKLKTLSEGAKLRLVKPLRPVLRQETRWGSTHAMLRRYFVLRGFLSMDDDELAEFLPSPATHSPFKALLNELSDCESVSLALQGDDVDLLGARDLLDGLIAVKPILKTYIGASANIIHSPAFESGCCKVLAGDAAKLLRGEKTALGPFLQGLECEPQAVALQKEGFAERILKKRKIKPCVASYPLVSAIPPTSNRVERLFSVARAMIGHERQALSPLAVEMLLFLKVNASYWDVEVVDRCV